MLQSKDTVLNEREREYTIIHHKGTIEFWLKGLKPFPQILINEFRTRTDFGIKNF